MNDNPYREVAEDTYRAFTLAIAERDEAREWARRMRDERDKALLHMVKITYTTPKGKVEEINPAQVEEFPPEEITTIDIDHAIDIINAEIKRIFKDAEDPFSPGYVFGGNTWYIFKGLEKARDLLVDACRKPNK